jgi:hypothetical protein
MDQYELSAIPNICRKCGKTVYLWFLATGVICGECTDFHGHYKKKEFDKIIDLFKEEL